MEFTPELMMNLMDSSSQEPKNNKLEHKRNSKIIIIRQDKLSQTDALNFVKTLRTIPKDKTLEIILHTPGGSLAAAEVIVNAILNHKGKTIVYIPEYTLSEGVIIALAADEIYLNKNAYIGPIDPQFGFGYSASSLLKYTDQLDKSSSSWITDIAKFMKLEAKKSLDWTTDIFNRICTVRDLEMTREIYEISFCGRYSHDRPLFFQDVDEMIQHLYEGVPDEIYDLHLSNL